MDTSFSTCDSGVRVPEAGATVYLGTLDGAGARPAAGGCIQRDVSSRRSSSCSRTTNAVKVQRVDLDRGQMVGEIEELLLDVDRHLGHAALTVSRRWHARICRGRFTQSSPPLGRSHRSRDRERRSRSTAGATLRLLQMAYTQRSSASCQTRMTSGPSTSRAACLPGSPSRRTWMTIRSGRRTGQRSRSRRSGMAYPGFTKNVCSGRRR